MRLYDYLPSGNGYKIRLLLTQLGLPFERVEVDIVHGASRTPEVLQRNPNGRIPVLELDDFDLGRFPTVQAWLAHVRGQPGHIPITQG